MNQYLLMISMDGGEAVPCLPVDEKALGLNQDGITWQDKAVVRIYRDDRNELSVRTESDTSVMLERSGRSLLLNAREVRLLPKDVICFGGHHFEIVSMRRFEESKRRFSSRQAMLSAAAAFALVAVPACQPRNAGYPETPPQVETRTGGDVVPEGALPEPELKEDASGEVPDVAPAEAPKEVDLQLMGDVAHVEPDEAGMKEEEPKNVNLLPAGMPPAPREPVPVRREEPPEVMPRTLGKPVPEPVVDADCGCKDGETCDCADTGKPCACRKDAGEEVKRPEVDARTRGKMVFPVSPESND